MKLNVIVYGGTVHTFDAKSFEFRTNQHTNWIDIILNSGEKITIRGVSVIKTV